MIAEKIVVSDANIFFDLISVDLLGSFFRLPCQIITTDFVINEITNIEQLNIVCSYIKTNELKVKSLDSNELEEVLSIYNKNENNASIADCSVWYYAKKTEGRLLTGDAKLKKSAMRDNIKVSGLIFVLENLIEYQIIDKESGADKLEYLMKINTRLPKIECINRIQLWRK